VRRAVGLAGYRWDLPRISSCYECAYKASTSRRMMRRRLNI